MTAVTLANSNSSIVAPSPSRSQQHDGLPTFESLFPTFFQTDSNDLFLDAGDFLAVDYDQSLSTAMSDPAEHQIESVPLSFFSRLDGDHPPSVGCSSTSQSRASYSNEASSRSTSNVDCTTSNFHTSRRLLLPATSPSTSASSSTSSVHILGVPGLTQELLDESVCHCLDHIDRILPLFDTTAFRIRYCDYISPSHHALSQSRSSLLEMGQEEDAETSPNMLLLLAVIAKGIAYTSHPARFSLQADMLDSLTSAIREDEDPVKRGGLALLQALVIVSDCISVHSDTQAWEMRNKNPLHVHPLSHESLVMLTSQWIQRTTSPTTRECRQTGSRGLKPSQSDTVTLLNLVYTFDCFRRLGNQTPMIREEERHAFLGMEESTILDQDGFALTSTRSVMNPLISLAMLAGDIRRILHPIRTQVKNRVDTETVQRLLDNLMQWQASLPQTLSCQSQQAYGSERNPRPLPSVRATTLRALWLTQLLDVSLTVTAGSEMIGTPFGCHELRQVLQLKAQMVSLETIYLATICLATDYMAHSFLSLRNLVHFICQCILDRLQFLRQGDLDRSEHKMLILCNADEAELLTHARLLIRALERTTSLSDSAAIVQRLQLRISALSCDMSSALSFHQCLYCHSSTCM